MMIVRDHIASQDNWPLVTGSAHVLGGLCIENKANRVNHGNVVPRTMQRCLEPMAATSQIGALHMHSVEAENRHAGSHPLPTNSRDTLELFNIAREGARG